MAKMTLEEVKKETKDNLNIEFSFNGNWFAIAGGDDAFFWTFYKNGEDVGEVEGFENVFTFKFIEGKSIVEVFEEIEPTIEFD